MFLVPKKVSAVLGSLWKKFRIDPYWRAGIQVAAAIIFTFLPILLFSIPILEGGDAITKETVINNFWSYWKSGELVLPLLGICGTLVAIVTLNRALIPGFLVAVSLFAAVVVSAVGGYLLGTNKGFANDLLPEIVFASFGAYFVIIIIWFLLELSVNQETRHEPNSDERADNLLRDKAKREAQQK